MFVVKFPVIVVVLVVYVATSLMNKYEYTCFRFVCIYACAAVFLCCCRFFSVNRDLYNIQVSTVADGPARRADCRIVLCNKLAKVAGRTPTVASIVNLSSTDEGRWFITLSDHLCRTKLAVRHLHYAEKDNTGCYKTNVSCSCFMSVAFILCNGISQEQSNGWIKTKKTHVAV